MARNPYVGLGSGADLYTNGNGYGTSTTISAGGTDEYDPYGDRYGTPPIAAANTGRDRRAARTGGYGGFYENSNGSSPAAQSTGRREQSDGYGTSPGDGPLPVRSPRRPGGPDQSTGRGYRQDRGDADSSGGSRGAEYRRGADRQYQNGGEAGNDSAMGRSRGVPRGGGDGTRQIEG